MEDTPMKSALALLLVSCTLAVAQAPAAPAPQPETPQLAGAANLASLKPDGLKISDSQVEDIDLYNTKIDLIASSAEQQSQQISFRASSMASPWLQKRQAVIDLVIKANPGWQWHPAQSAQDTSRFQRIPPPGTEKSASPAPPASTPRHVLPTPPTSIPRTETPETPASPSPAVPATPAK
jgi:hypothetical protein